MSRQSLLEAIAAKHNMALTIAAQLASEYVDTASDDKRQRSLKYKEEANLWRLATEMVKANIAADPTPAQTGGEPRE